MGRRVVHERDKTYWGNDSCKNCMSKVFATIPCSLWPKTELMAWMLSNGVGHDRCCYLLLVFVVFVVVVIDIVVVGGVHDVVASGLSA